MQGGGAGFQPRDVGSLLGSRGSADHPGEAFCDAPEETDRRRAGRPEALGPSNRLNRGIRSTSAMSPGSAQPRTPGTQAAAPRRPISRRTWQTRALAARTRAGGTPAKGLATVAVACCAPKVQSFRPAALPRPLLDDSGVVPRRSRLICDSARPRYDALSASLRVSGEPNSRSERANQHPEMAPNRCCWRCLGPSLPAAQHRLVSPNPRRHRCAGPLDVTMALVCFGIPGAFKGEEIRVLVRRSPAKSTLLLYLGLRSSSRRARSIETPGHDRRHVENRQRRPSGHPREFARRLGRRRSGCGLGA